MKTNNAWQQDSEYVAIVEDLLAQPAVQRLCFIMTGVKPSLISARTHLFIRG